jgi:hypothetical protein
VGFVVEKVALGQVFLRVLLFSPVSIIPPWIFIFIYHLRNEQQARWWLVFGDLVSPHPREQQQQNGGEN